MAKAVVLGDFDTQEQARVATDMAKAFAPLMGKNVHVEMKTRYQLVAIRGNGLVATKEITAKDKTELACKYNDGRTFNTEQGRKVHYALGHKKNKK